jgi:hypothetical protein
VETDRQRPPGEVSQVALVAAMHGRRRDGTEGTARRRGGGREPEVERLLFDRHGLQLHRARRGEKGGEKSI